MKNIDRSQYRVGDERLPIGVLISNYNMPECVDRWVEYLTETTRWPHEIVVVDNGSDKVPPSKYTTISWKENLGHNASWQLGFEHIYRLEMKRKRLFFGYLIITTSTIIAFPERRLDLISPLVEILLADEQVAIINASHAAESTTPFDFMKTRETGGPREVGFVETGFALFREKWFKHVGGIEKEFFYNWGTDVDPCYKAHRSKRKVMVHDGVVVKKDHDNGFILNRYEMKAEERVMKSMSDMNYILCKKYGLTHPELLAIMTRHSQANANLQQRAKDYLFEIRMRTRAAVRKIGSRHNK